MKLLLDTHALLWSLSDDPRLEPRARAFITDRGNDVLVSLVSLWEIAIKIRIGKLKVDVEEVQRGLHQQGFQLLPIEPRHLFALDRLPVHEDHRDPFDHLLIAQAIMIGATFVSEDRNMHRYAVDLLSCSGT